MEQEISQRLYVKTMLSEAAKLATEIQCCRISIRNILTFSTTTYGSDSPKNITDGNGQETRYISITLQI